MGSFGQTGLMLVNTIASIYLLILMARFLLQLSKADYYNPVSQTVIKLTQPIVAPLQKILRPIGPVDIATLVVGLIFKALVVMLVLHLAGLGQPPIVSLLLTAVAGVLNAILKIYFFAMIIMIILSWVAPNASHPAALLVMQIVEPIMAPVRKVIPPLGMIDLSPIVVFIAINLLDAFVVGGIARAAGLPGLLAGL